MNVSKILKFSLLFALCAGILLLVGLLVGCESGPREHPHAAASWEIVVAPTCAAEGLATGACAECGMDMELVLPKIAHEFTKTVVEPACEAEGYTRYTCDCGYIYDTEYTKPVGHSYTETVTPPACEEEGYTTYTCACGHTYKADYTQPVGHSYTETVTPPTCEEEGYTTYTCACGHTYMADYTQPVGHSYTETVTPPTCEEEGYTTYTCACGHTYTADYTQPVGHSYTETVTPPTCEEEGYTTYVCACGHTYMADYTQPVGHSYTETVTPPTCEEEGYTTYTCGCGYTFDANYVQPTGHACSAARTVQPACEAMGYTVYLCSCGYTYDGDYVGPTGHSFTEDVTVQPTCTEEGYTHYVCDACGTEVAGNTVPPLNHIHSTAEFFYATVSRDGFTRHTCADCGYVRDDGFVSYHDIVTGAYVDTTEILMQGVDTSKWNHEYGTSLEDVKPLDWAALKAQGVDFVILKAGSTLGKDPAFEQDYRDAKAAGLQVGAYFYAYSTTEEGTLADAEQMISWLEGKQFELPIYFDAEEDALYELGTEALTGLCRLFVERLQEAGYYAALYTNTEWLYNLLDTEWVKANLDVWYARYVADQPDGSSAFSLEDDGFTWKDGTAYKPGETDRRFGVWQYTQYGYVEGFRYRFDFDYCYKDYRSIMIRWGLNGYEAVPPGSDAGEPSLDV